jgi:hypothetical protein
MALRVVRIGGALCVYRLGETVRCLVDGRPVLVGYGWCMGFCTREAASMWYG